MIYKAFKQYRQQKKFRKFYQYFIRGESIFFDVGANIGNRTEAFLNIGAKVVAAEPVKQTFDELARKFGNHKNATLLNCGIGSKNGTELIYISDISEVCTLSKKFIEAHENQKHISLKWDKTQTTSITTLDHLINQYGMPDFCKIDVEGYELEVFKGLSVPMPMLSFEYNVRLKHIAIECIDYLSRFSNLAYNFSAYETMEFEFERWKTQAEFRKYISNLSESILTGDVYVKHVC